MTEGRRRRQVCGGLASTFINSSFLSVCCDAAAAGGPTEIMFHLELKHVQHQVEALKGTRASAGSEGNLAFATKSCANIQSFSNCPSFLAPQKSISSCGKASEKAFKKL